MEMWRAGNPSHTGRSHRRQYRWDKPFPPFTSPYNRLYHIFSPRSHALRGNAYSNRRKIDWVGTDIKFMNQHTRTS